MSAVQALRNRLGFGLRLSGVAVDATGLGSSVVARVAGHGSAGPMRAESLFRRHVGSHGAIREALEIGHRGDGRADWLADGVRHEKRDVVVDGRPSDLVAALRALPSSSFDLVFSVDAVEHVRKPWLVADEICRVLRPGGITFHTTVFTTRYQPQPEDFFRFTPDGLKSLFGDLECLTAEFDATDRRRDRARTGRDDIFGGSREGWRVNYAGRKAFHR